MYWMTVPWSKIVSQGQSLPLSPRGEERRTCPLCLQEHFFRKHLLGLVFWKESLSKEVYAHSQESASGPSFGPSWQCYLEHAASLPWTSAFLSISRSSSVRLRSVLTLENSRTHHNVSWEILVKPLGQRGEAVAGDMGKAFMRDDKVYPRTGGWSLLWGFHHRGLQPPELLHYFSERQTFTKNPEC